MTKPLTRCSSSSFSFSLIRSESMAHPVSQERQLPGGIQPTMTVIDTAHPLSNMDLALDTALTGLTPKILESYLEAKHLPASDSHDFEFEPVGFTTQTVAGTNYYVKLLVHDKCHTDKQTKEYIHIRIFVQVWTNTIQLTGLSVDKHESDSLRGPIAEIVE